MLMIRIPRAALGKRKLEKVRRKGKKYNVKLLNQQEMVTVR